MAALNLTSDQQATVENKSLSADALPEYFNAANKTDQKISRDFEAFLILSSGDLKTSALDWIQKAVKLNKTHQQRDDLTVLALGQELKNAQAKLTEYDNQLGDFDSFRKNFQTSSQFAQVGEVQLFLSDLQAVIEELSVGRDRAFFDQTVTTIMQGFGGRVGITDDQVQELQSWTAVISTYLGG